MRRTLLVIALVLFSVPCFAHEPGNECTPAGTWYGGTPDSTAKWLLTITPLNAGRFTIVYDQGFTPAIPKLSPFSGVLVRQRDGRYRGQALALANASSTPPPLGGPNPSIWAIREFGQFTDCDTLEFEIDFYAIYNWGRTPFVDLPDGSRLPPSGIVRETYHRMSTHCPVCLP